MDSFAYINATLLVIGLICYIAIRILQQKNDIELISGGGELILLFVTFVLFMISDLSPTKNPVFVTLAILSFLLFAGYSVYSINNNNSVQSDKKLLYIVMCIFAKYFMIWASVILLALMIVGFITKIDFLRPGRVIDWFTGMVTKK